MITDTERLEFITDDDNYYYTVRSNRDRTDWVVWDQSDGLCIAGQGATMREALDNAMIYAKGVRNV